MLYGRLTRNIIKCTFKKIMGYDMGAANPFPKYQFPYPPPVNKTWAEYMKQCSFRHKARTQTLFDKSV
jgi:hypothetical protein